MNDQQRESTAKFLYDMAKGIGLIAVVGGMANGQANWRSVMLGSTAMVVLFFSAYWLERRGD